MILKRILVKFETHLAIKQNLMQKKWGFLKAPFFTNSNSFLFKPNRNIFNPREIRNLVFRDRIQIIFRQT